MKKINKAISVLLLFCILISCLSSCGNEKIPEPENKDFVSELKLDMSSETLKQQVTVKTFVDGDTTHFYVPQGITDSGVFKARYLAINTPESTGKIEEYGKKASDFTHEKLSSATSIIIESDDGKWNLDSTGSRYLVWVWYKTSESGEYRNLNLEILQNGLAIASSSANNRYGAICTAAIAQAKTQKLNLYSGEKDSGFYYGTAIELTLKELRCNTAEYNGKSVAFEGVITKNYNNGVFIEEYDAETDMYYGMYIYYGFNLSGEGLDVLTVGNRSRIVGTVSFYEAGGTYQVSGLTYRIMKPNDPGNIQKISGGNSPSFVLTYPEIFASGKVKADVDGEEKEFGYAELAMGTTVEMRGLYVEDAKTTVNEESSYYGAMTLYCDAHGVKVNLRTVVLLDENGEIVTSDAYLGKYIDVKGIVDYFSGEYQIKIFSGSDIIINK